MLAQIRLAEEERIREQFNKVSNMAQLIEEEKRSDAMYRSNPGLESAKHDSAGKARNL
jgi:hypothetical protein